MKDLGLKLLRAESEAEVLQIVESNSRMSDADNWHPVDKRETNYNIVTNQSATGGKAATELITNMVDAMLMKLCREKGVDPKGRNAPRTMYRAVDRFVAKLNGGRIINADDTWLRDYAKKNLIIGVTGASQGACYTFADNGEGQHPQHFPTTFLSLSEKNKSDIPFVQGKYNMGSSGVLNFCGEQWFKLIVSRRHDKTGQWGWTLVRKRPGDASTMPVAEYFAPRGKIPTLESMEMVIPFRDKSKREFDEFSLGSGTVVKLYDFYVGRGFSGFRGAREAFNENLVETILPFRILDFRQTPTKGRGLRERGIDERPFYGMEFLLRRSHAEDPGAEESADETPAEKALPLGTVSHPTLGKITVTAIPVKKGLDRNNWFRKSRNRVFHHVNGQVQYKQQRGFLSQCGLPALMDRAAIFVDASGLKDAAHHGIWKGDRESIRETKPGEAYKAEVRDIIKGSEVLKELNHRIAREELDSAAKEESRELVRDLLRRDRNLVHILDATIPDLPVPSIESKPKAPFKDHQYSPTYVKIKGRKFDIELPVNRTRPIPCTTDAAADYFDRADNRGDLHFEDNETRELFMFKTSHDEFGNLTVFARPEKMRVGDEHSFRIGLKDDAMPEPVYSEASLRIRIVAKAPPPPPPPPPPTPQTSRGLPPVKLLTRDGRDIDGKPTTKWDDEDLPGDAYNEHDGGTVKDLGEVKIYYINFDNTFFQNHLKLQKREDAKAAVTQKYILGMRIALLGMEHSLMSVKEDEGDGFDKDRFRRLAAKGAATVMVTLCDQLPKSFDLNAGGGDDDAE